MFRKLVGARGFEPPTPSLPGERAALIILRFFGNWLISCPLISHAFLSRLATVFRVLAWLALLALGRVHVFGRVHVLRDAASVVGAVLGAIGSSNATHASHLVASRKLFRRRYNSSTEDGPANLPNPAHAQPLLKSEICFAFGNGSSSEPIVGATGEFPQLPR